jgi:LmbE family N-acetylglucosaminyl deacetylase
MRRHAVIFLAHPDDESFSMGGTIAKLREQGYIVSLVCATRGEEGSRSDRASPHDQSNVGATREIELANAAQVLGIKEVMFLGYRDSGMTLNVAHHKGVFVSATVGEAADLFIQFVAGIRPTLVITHDKFGGYGHPDHIQCYLVVLETYRRLYGLDLKSNTPPTHSDPNIPWLYCLTISKQRVRMFSTILRLFGKDPAHYGANRDIDLDTIASWEMPITTKINVRKQTGKKVRAMEMHISQAGRLQKGLVGRMVAWLDGYECFARIYPPIVDNQIEHSFP